MTGRPKKFMHPAAINFWAEKEFKDRLNKLADRNNETIYEIIIRSVNHLYPVTNDLEIEEAELNRKLEDIRLLKKQKLEEEEVKNREYLEKKAELDLFKNAQEEFYSLREYNKDLMDSCYKEVRNDIGRGNMFKLYKACVKRFKELEKNEVFDFKLKE